MKTVWLDGRLYGDLEKVYRELDRNLHFPDHFGHNLDALYDVLSETSERTEIYITNRRALREKVKNGDVLISLLMNCADETPDLHVYLFS
ncbi:MAG: barstar family protein [Clostridia bacterium]|nr:barstar family protein [Clostridia bacterium]